MPFSLDLIWDLCIGLELDRGTSDQEGETP